MGSDSLTASTASAGPLSSALANRTAARPAAVILMKRRRLQLEAFVVMGGFLALRVAEPVPAAFGIDLRNPEPRRIVVLLLFRSFPVRERQSAPAAPKFLAVEARDVHPETGWRTGYCTSGVGAAPRSTPRTSAWPASTATYCASARSSTLTRNRSAT